jgi:Cu(I)/Ag(I) efflux system periplasmic protein CusF
VAGFAWMSLPSPDSQTPGAPPQTARGTGVVQSIDQERGVVTISHGPVPALDMMAMTMVFPVRDKDQLANLQPMQRVEFQLAYDGRDYLIFDIR